MKHNTGIALKGRDLSEKFSNQPDLMVFVHLYLMYAYIQSLLILIQTKIAPGQCYYAQGICFVKTMRA